MLDGLSRGFHAMGCSSAELKQTAGYYRETDQASAAGLDATYPSAARPPIDPPDPTRGPVLSDGQMGPAYSSAGTDVADPMQHLRTPRQPEEFTDPLKLFNVVDDLFSPSWWMSQVLEDTIGGNPLEEATKFVIGDWQGFARCGLVWEDLGRSTGAIADNVKYGLTWVAGDWQGQAADAAVVYFDALYRALGSHRDTFQQIHEKYLDVARGVWNAARAVTDILKDLLDNLIIAGIMVVGAALTSWTGIGPGISLLAAGYQCERIIDLWGDASGWLSSTQTVIEAFVGFLQSQEAHVLDEIKPVSMPAIDYDHPNRDIGSEPVGRSMKGR